MSPLDDLVNEVDGVVAEAKAGKPICGFILILRRPAPDPDEEVHEAIVDDGADDEEVANIMHGMAELVEVEGTQVKSGGLLH